MKNYMTLLVVGVICAYFPAAFAQEVGTKSQLKSKTAKSKKASTQAADTLKMEMPDGTTVTVISKTKEGIKNLSKVDLSELLREYGGKSESQDSTAKESKLFYAPQAAPAPSMTLKAGQKAPQYSAEQLDLLLENYKANPTEANKKAVIDYAQLSGNQAGSTNALNAANNKEASAVNSVSSNTTSFLAGGVKVTTTEARVDSTIKSKNSIVTIKSKKDKAHYGTFSIDFGFSNWLKNGAIAGVNSDVLYQLSPIGSRYVSLKAGHRIRLAKSGDTRIYLQTGLDATWYNYMFQKDVVPERTDNGLKFRTMTELGYTELSRNKITNFFVGVPLMVYAKDVRNFNFGLGAYVGYRLLSYRKIAFVENGKDQSERLRSDFFTLPYQYGVRGQVGYKGVDLFVNYNLTPTFTKSSGLPELNTITFGIEI